MGHGSCVLLIGVFVGVFAAAVGYEVLKKTGVVQATADKVSESLQAAKNGFNEAYQSAAQPSDGT